MEPISLDWHGVMPAMTTPFGPTGEIDHDFARRHAQWMVEAGCTGIIAPGSLGEGNTLRLDERAALWETLVAALAERAPVIAAISALSTDEAVAMAQLAATRGCQGLMVLPPYVYRGDWPEMRAHVGAVFAATSLPCMLYNNPVAYGTDFTPEQIAELAEAYPTLAAVKESSTDLRRLTGIRALLGERLALLVGVDDAIVEGIAAGAVGWVAGLVNAFPHESVALFEAARRGAMAEAFALYRWFLPLLRMDTVPKFVQLIKLAQQEVGWGSEAVRPPRLPLTCSEREQTLAEIRAALRNRPALSA
ncbi:MAG: dihydrodipicolinate synthase family protein [Blastocatellia bacterium]